MERPVDRVGDGDGREEPEKAEIEIEKAEIEIEESVTDWNARVRDAYTVGRLNPIRQ